jgi:hypothetical protein
MMILKIYSELAAHIDGYIASVAHTVIVGGEVISGRRADVIIAAQNALEASLRLLKKGTNVSVFLFQPKLTVGEMLWQFFNSTTERRDCQDNSQGC